MKIFPADETILTPRSTLSGADDSIASINTSLLADGAVVMLKVSGSFYRLNKTSVEAESLPNIVAPAQGGPGRWYKMQVIGAPASLTVTVPDIGPQTTVEASATVPGKQSSSDLVLANVTDSGLPTGVGLVAIRPATGATTATFRFMNATGATISGRDVGLRAAVIPA